MEKMPGNEVALLHLGRAYVANGQWREAADTYSILTGQEEVSADVRLYLGYLLIRSGDVQAGLASLRAGLEQGGVSGAIMTQELQNVGNTLLDMGYPAEAEAFYQSG